MRVKPEKGSRQMVAGKCNPASPRVSDGPGGCASVCPWAGLCWAVQHHICSAQTGKCPCEKLCIFNEQSTKNILVSNVLLIIVNFEFSYFVVREHVSHFLHLLY